MLFQFANVLVFILFSVLFILALLVISKLLSPRHHSADKLASYECGERPTGPGWLQFNIRFYIIALAFLIFDVEIAFMFPVGMVMRGFVESGQGWFVLAEVLLFILILFLGLVYLWRKGDLDWVKDLQLSRGESPIELRRHSRSRPE
jgi:NADH-quinone oxidoreductase subunit A